MVERPELNIDIWLSLGASRVIFHYASVHDWESIKHIDPVIRNFTEIGLAVTIHDDLEKIHPLWMFIIGSGTGIVGGLFGIGAGVLMIPIFIVIFNLEKNYARALSLAILLPPVSIGAFIKYMQEGVIQWKLSLILFISYFLANYFGAKLGTKSKLLVFKKVYAALLIIIAVFYLI